MSLLLLLNTPSSGLFGNMTRPLILRNSRTAQLQSGDTLDVPGNAIIAGQVKVGSAASPTLFIDPNASQTTIKGLVWMDGSKITTHNSSITFEAGTLTFLGNQLWNKTVKTDISISSASGFYQNWNLAGGSGKIGFDANSTVFKIQNTISGGNIEITPGAGGSTIILNGNAVTGGTFTPTGDLIAPVLVRRSTDTAVALSVRGNIGDSFDLQEWGNDSSPAMVSINATGYLTAQGLISTQLTAPSGFQLTLMGSKASATAGAIGTTIGSTLTLTDSGAKTVQISNGGEVAYFDKVGDLFTGSNKHWHAGTLTLGGAAQDLSTAASNGSGIAVALANHVHRITTSNVTTALGYTPTRTSGTGNSNSVISADTRSTADTPTSRDAGLFVDFKQNTTDGLADGGTYHGVLTFRAYGSSTDLSGGVAWQLGTTENGNIYRRISTSTTTWGSWARIHSDSNFDDTGHGSRGGGSLHAVVVASGAAGFMSGADKAKLDAYSGSLSGSNTGDVTLTTIGSTPNGNGASLSGQQLQLQPASGSFGGVVTTAAQTFAGLKTFSNGIISTTIGDTSNTVQITGTSVSLTHTNGNYVWIQGNGALGAHVFLGNGTGNDIFEMGTPSSTGNRQILLTGAPSYTYGLMIDRPNGDNSISSLFHRGTGAMQFHANEAADFTWLSSASEKMRLTTGGTLTLSAGIDTNAAATLNVGVTTATTLQLGRNTNTNTNIDGGVVQIRTASGGAISLISAAATDTALNLGSTSTSGDHHIEIGQTVNNNSNGYIDFKNNQYTDYALRVIRTSGLNADSNISHRGSGNLNLNGQDGGPVVFMSSSTEMARVNSTGLIIPSGSLVRTPLIDAAADMQFKVPSSQAFTWTQGSANLVGLSDLGLSLYPPLTANVSFPTRNGLPIYHYYSYFSGGIASQAIAWQHNIEPTAATSTAGDMVWRDGGATERFRFIGTGDMRMHAQGSTSSNPRTLTLGWGAASGNNARLAIIDDNSGVQGGFGNRTQIYSYHNLELYGLQTGTIPTFTAGSGTDRPVIVQNQGWTNLTYTNSWVSFDTTNYHPARYMMDANGFVHLSGLVKNGTIGSSLATLPTGYRPAKKVTFVSFGGTPEVANRIEITTTGTITILSGPNAYVSLENITFPIN